MEMKDTLKRTPLYHEHVTLGGKMVPFAGYEMPVHYKDGIIAEHETVRMAAGLFDASHMGEFKAWGPQALDFIQKVVHRELVSQLHLLLLYLVLLL